MNPVRGVGRRVSLPCWSLRSCPLTAPSARLSAQRSALSRTVSEHLSKFKDKLFEGGKPPQNETQPQELHKFKVAPSVARFPHRMEAHLQSLPKCNRVVTQANNARMLPQYTNIQLHWIVSRENTNQRCKLWRHNRGKTPYLASNHWIQRMKTQMDT